MWRKCLDGHHFLVVPGWWSLKAWFLVLCNRYLNLVNWRKVGKWLWLGRMNRVRVVKLMKLCHPACGQSGTNNLKTLKETKADLKKKSNNPNLWSREGHPNSISGSAGDSGGYVFTEEMLAVASFAKIFVTGPEELLRNKFCVFCKLRKKIFPCDLEGYMN